VSLEKIFIEFPVIETERLILKELKDNHALDIFEYFSDEEVLEYYDIYPLTEIEEAEKLISVLENRFKKQKGIRWGISLKSSGKIIGTCGYHNLDKESFKAEIGYELSREYWRQGIMKEALGAIISFGFKEMELNRIEALVELENSSSIKLLEKLRFREEGLLREFAFYKEKFNDLIMFSILKRGFMKE